LIPSLANGASAELVIVATVQTTNAVTNIARRTRADQFDPNATNNVAEVTLSALAADLAVTKTASTTSPQLNDVIRFVVTVSNNGPGTATGVVVSDAIPRGLTLVSQTASVGSYDPATGVWSISALANAASATLTVELRVTSQTPSFFTNTATVASATPDLVGNNNVAVVRVNVAPIAVPTAQFWILALLSFALLVLGIKRLRPRD
jgi:uncharacterized repeat protein (TIGR01451 family)